jgi:glycosyltransferase involved in cell wall biosynthesis
VKFLFLVPGTSNYFCGTCLRDQALAQALRAAGHAVEIACLYLPLHVEREESRPPPLFFGGVNCYLQQRFALFRRTPRWVDALFDAPALLRAAGRRAGMTRPEELVDMTLSMLAGLAGRQAKEVRRLVDWIAGVSRPDVVVFSNALLLGSAPALREAMPRVQLHCTLQGEDTFVEGLPASAQPRVWAAMAANGRALDRWIAVSDFYREKMLARIGMPPERIVRVHNGLDLSPFAPAREKSGPPVIGYLSRLCHPKGIHTFLEAFGRLRQRPEFGSVRALVGGSRTAEDAALVRGLLAALPPETAAAVEVRPNLSLVEKARLLRECHLLSVPVNYDEAFGLYLPEAMASGTPVVQAHKGAAPEIIAATGGGMTYRDDTAAGLADAWAEALSDPARLRAWGRAGAEGARARFPAEAMARGVLEACETAQPVAG